MNWDKTIFLAHATEDKPMVRRIYNELLKSGLKPWLDEDSLPPGVKWEDEIKKAIKNSRFFVACISRNSIVKNGFVQKELKLALQQLELKAADNIYFIPALLEDVELPDISVNTVNLRDYQASKLFEPRGLEILTSFLKKQVNLIQQIEVKNPNKYKIKDLISDAKIDQALELLKYHGEKTDYYNNIIMLQGRYKELKDSFLLGSIPHELYRTEENRIIIAILDITDLL